MQEPHQPSKLQEKDLKLLFDLAYNTILELETPLGINASGKKDPYAAFFGRDSMITGLKLLRVYQRQKDKTFLRIVKKVLKTAARLQGKEINLRSGEKPGKIIHEYREVGYYHLISRPEPWYLYPDKTLRNYDSTDSTTLFLILAAEFYNLTTDEEFLKEILPTVNRAFFWAENYGYKEGNRLFLEYQLHRPPHVGGLVNQGWMDSIDSVLIHGEPPKEPIALVEAQGYYFKALSVWSEIYENIDKEKAKKHRERAKRLRDEFNKLFIMKSEGLYYFSYALFGQKAHLLEIRSNPGHCLWASAKLDGKYESIIDQKYIKDLVSRLMKPDLFASDAGIRTLSSGSKFFNPFSYHNGSIWPFDNGIIAEGFENFGFHKEAQKIKEAILHSILHFNTAIELYCIDKDGSLNEYKEKSGHLGSKIQAWTAATILDFTTNY